MSEKFSQLLIAAVNAAYLSGNEPILRGLDKFDGVTQYVIGLEWENTLLRVKLESYIEEAMQSRNAKASNE